MADLLERLAESILVRLHGEPPHLVGVAGPVAVGKSAVADALADGLRRRGRGVHVVCTDAFLLPNAVLAERGLGMRKGFPETFDVEALSRCVRALKAEGRARLPVYSHAVYDVLPDACTEIADVEVVVLEGVNVLQDPLVGHLDVTVYVDADPAVVRAWFVERFVRLTDQARTNESSFYRRFVSMPEDSLRSVAEGAWDAINAVNLLEHIAPSRSRATFIVTKHDDHSVAGVREA